MDIGNLYEDERKYKIAVDILEISMLEYDVISGSIIANCYSDKDLNFPLMQWIKVAEWICCSPICSSSKNELRRLFKVIDEGAPVAKAAINMRTQVSEKTFELNFVSIFDDNGQVIRAVGVVKDISLNTSLEEQEKCGMAIASNQFMLYCEKMVAKSIATYSLDVTNGIFLLGHEKWQKFFGTKYTDKYEEILAYLYNKVIYHDDIEVFKKTFLLCNMMDAYEMGIPELTCEYRRVEKGVCIWVRTTAHLFWDSVTGNLKALFYVENINKNKLEALDMIYKSEHDMLTGFYNKTAVEKYIMEFLTSEEGESGIHAFFMIDTDYFKSINDNFGHAFGDVVLSQVADKIRESFREDDILGRVGGDEFAVFMKNTKNIKAVVAKATELCKKLIDSFHKRNVKHTISASVGIAIYGEHGTTYEELYKNADTALYVSKQNSRNRYTLYKPTMAPMDSGSNESEKF